LGGILRKFFIIHVADGNLSPTAFGAYNETQLRRDFLDKFIRALGWDVDNEQGCHESFREVINEDRTIDAFRVLDPACGSGSFLINAYQYLLDW